MSSREQILGKLRQGKRDLPRERPFPNAQSPAGYLPMIPNIEQDQTALTTRFVQEAEKAGCVVHPVSNNQEAIDAVMQLIGEDTAVSCWQLDQIPVSGLSTAFDQANIDRLGQDAHVRVGLTGVDAALAATGSVVVKSGNGRYRATSLLPPVHIAVVTASQIVPDLESWWAVQKTAGLEQTRKHSNIVVITGPSRTADIAMQLVMGMHGPKILHIVLLP
jgi:L-lactate dehydrogenase complex protein LldG